MECEKLLKHLNNTKISITFPDGNSKEYDKGITGYKIAESIAKSLAKEAIAVEINNEISDLSLEINLKFFISQICMV